MRFEEVYEGWKGRRLSQEEAARILGICQRSFRRYRGRYEAEGMAGLIDRRIGQVSHRRAPVDEVMAVEAQYRGDMAGGMYGIFTAFTSGKEAGAVTRGSRASCRRRGR